MRLAYIIFCNDIPYFVVPDDFDFAKLKMTWLKLNHYMNLYWENHYKYTDYEKEYDLKYIWHISTVPCSTDLK